MVRLSGSQQTLLAETLRDIANLATGAMVFGQFLADALFSTGVARGGIALFGIVVAVLDWLGRRKDRQSRNRAA